MPRASADATDAFRSLVPAGPGVALRPMFGNLAGFINGNMFAGLFGERLFVRLPEDQRTRLLGIGGGDFEPMPGRAMRGYSTLPDGWVDDAAGARRWVGEALRFTSELPAKTARSKQARK